MGHEELSESENLLEAQKGRLGEKLVSMIKNRFRHAVGAAEIASIGDRNA
jgi:hypothetical protein